MRPVATGRCLVRAESLVDERAVDDGITGVLVASGDVDALARACAQLLGDPGGRAAMGAAATRLAAERFDLRRQAARLAELYTEIAR